MPDRKTVMISSTARDLPQHRQAVMDACLRQGMFPLMMEHLPAERIFLRKVGGGYIFVHRLLQDYFAELWEKEYAEAERDG